MDEDKKYTWISESTVINARNRALAALKQITSDRVDEAIKLVEEFKELDSIAAEFAQK